MILLIMLSQFLNIFVNFELNQACLWVLNLLPLLFANITKVVLLSKMLIESVLVVKTSVLTKLALWMLSLLMLIELVVFVKLLLKKKNRLVFNT